MAKHTFLSVLLITILALLGGIYLSSFKDPLDNHAGFPWQVDILDDGSTRVFSLTLGKSQLIDAEKLFKSIAEITLFSVDGGEASVEAFFRDIKSAGLNARMVISMDLSQQQMTEMLNRGARISTLGSGTRKVTLSSEDAERVRYSAISSITYLPSTQLDAELIEKRFGVPAEKLADSQSDAIHWLYPSKGIDIALSENSKEVIQYVLPERFDALVQPLKKTVSEL